MNSLTWFIYLASIADNLSTLFAMFAVIGGIAFSMLYVLTAIYNEDKYNKRDYPSKYWIVLVFLFALIASLLPSERTVYMMAGAEVTTRAMESPKGQELETKILNKLDDLLKTKDK